MWQEGQDKAAATLKPARPAHQTLLSTKQKQRFNDRSDGAIEKGSMGQEKWDDPALDNPVRSPAGRMACVIAWTRRFSF
jgi:hypothetical protein